MNPGNPTKDKQSSSDPVEINAPWRDVGNGSTNISFRSPSYISPLGALTAVEPHPEIKASVFAVIALDSNGSEMASIVSAWKVNGSAS